MNKTRFWARFLGIALCPALAGVATACDIRGAEEQSAVEQSSPSQQTTPASPQATPAPPAAPAPAVKSPEPLSVGRKFTYALRRSFGPGAALSAFAVGGYKQAYNVNRGFGQGAEGYFSRVGSGYGTIATKHVVGSFFLASVFHQDPRYFPSGRRTIMARVGYAASRVLVARGDNGRAQFNVSTVGGAMGAGLISNAWHEPPDDTLGHGLTRGVLTLGVEALRNVFREFWPDIRRKLHR